MTDLEKTQSKKIGELQDLLEQTYDMSCLDDMINDLRSGEDDEMLLCNLSLKSQIMEALEDRKTIKDLKSIITEAPKMSVVAKLKHNSSEVLADHYEEVKANANS